MKATMRRFIDLIFTATVVAFSTGGASVADSRSITADRPSWVAIQPGVFQLGAQPGPDVLSTGAQRTYAGPDWDEAPIHEVRISQPYALASTKVTQAEFARFRSAYSEFLRSRGVEWNPASPAVLVTGHDAVAFRDGYADFNGEGSVLWRSRDRGETWQQLTRFGWNHQKFAQAGGQAGWMAGIHAPLVVLADGGQRGCRDLRVPRRELGFETQRSNVKRAR